MYFCGNLQNGVLAENKERVTDGAFIRVFDGKMWYYASTETLSNVQKELDGLYELAEYCADIEENPVVKRFEINRAKTFYLRTVRQNPSLGTKSKSC